MNTKLLTIPTTVANSFLLIGERVVLVDSGSPGNEKRILETLEHQGLEPKDLSLILLTHAHWDHLGSAQAIKTLSKAPIALHHADLEFAKAGRVTLKPYGFGSGLLAPYFSSKRFPPLTPDIVLHGNETLESYGVHAKLLSTPGHTNGSVSVLLENGDAILGDVLRGDFILDNRPNWHFFYDDLNLVRSSIKTLLNVKSKNFFVGHGKPFSFESLQRRFANKVNA